MNVNFDHDKAVVVETRHDDGFVGVRVGLVNS